MARKIQFDWQPELVMRLEYADIDRFEREQLRVNVRMLRWII